MRTLLQKKNQIISAFLINQFRLTLTWLPSEQLVSNVAWTILRINYSFYQLFLAINVQLTIIHRAALKTRHGCSWYLLLWSIHLKKSCYNRRLAAIYFHSLAAGFPLKEASIVLFVILYKTFKKKDIWHSRQYHEGLNSPWVRNGRRRLPWSLNRNSVMNGNIISFTLSDVDLANGQRYFGRAVWWVPDAVSKSLLPHLVTSSTIKDNHLII